tara:strand:- start:216 stop:449 length:234 start_codon:yes stop_codon:yes gene_type:complete
MNSSGEGQEMFVPPSIKEIHELCCVRALEFDTHGGVPPCTTHRKGPKPNQAWFTDNHAVGKMIQKISEGFRGASTRQ